MLEIIKLAGTDHYAESEDPEKRGIRRVQSVETELTRMRLKSVIARVRCNPELALVLDTIPDSDQILAAKQCRRKCPPAV